MRELPKLRHLPPTKKNYKETLKTADYSIAFQRAERRLIELQIKPSPAPHPITLGHDAFRQVNNLIDTVSDEKLESYYEQFLDMQLSAVEAASEIGKDAEVTEPDIYDHATNALIAIDREKERRASKFFDKEYPYPVTLLGMAEDVMKEMAAEGQQTKTISKVKNAANRFLEWREIDDIQMRLIRPKMVTDYVKAARSEERSHSTFKNDIHYLANVFKFALQQGYLDATINPFKDVSIKNFKNKIPRLSFSKEMLSKLLEASVADADLTQLVIVSYYTGMRLSEAFSAKLIVVENVHCFDVASEGGKTASAKRIIPIHPYLLEILATEGGLALKWSTKTANALGKRFGRLKNTVLSNLDPNLNKRSYCHHSFRHGFTTMLLEAGYQEIEMVDLTGHRRSNMGRTEAGRTYFGRQNINKLVEMISSIPRI